MTTPATCRFPSCLLLFGALTLFGCGPESVKTTGVSGNVTFDGVPLDEGIIEFENAPERWIQGSAPIEGGKYETALPAGSYRVRVFASRPSKPGDPGYSPNAYFMFIPAGYNTNTTLEITVPQEGGTFSFDLVSDPPRK